MLRKRVDSEASNAEPEGQPMLRKRVDSEASNAATPIVMRKFTSIQGAMAMLPSSSRCSIMSTPTQPS